MATHYYPRTLSRQIALVISTVLIVYTVIFAQISYEHINNDLKEALQNQGQVIAQNIVNSSQQLLQARQFTKLQHLLDNYIALTYVKTISLVSFNGKIILNTSHDTFTSQSKTRKKEVNGLNKDVINSNFAVPDTQHAQYDVRNLTAWYPIKNKGRPAAWVRVQLDKHVLTHHHEDEYYFITLLAISTGLISAVLITLFLRKPFQYIRQAAYFAEHLDSSVRTSLPVYEKAEELKKLSESLNLASARLAINEQETAEALKDLEAQQFAMDQHAVVSITDTAGNIIYANNKLCTLSGYSKAELLGQNHKLLNSGIHDEKFWEDFWHCIISGKVWQGEICDRAKDGSLFWTSTTIVPFLNHEGKPYQYVAIRNDITQFKQTTHNLLESEQRLKVSQQFAKIGSWELDLETNTIRLTQNALRLFGNINLPHEYSIDTFLSQVYHEDREKLSQVLKLCVKTGQVHQVEYRVILPDGNMHWVQSFGNVITDENGKQQKILGTSQDITERKLAAKEIEELARFPAENPNPIMRIGYDMELLYANNASEYFLASTDLEEGGHLPPTIAKKAAKVIQEKQDVSFELKVGGRCYSITISHIPDSTYLNLYALDITERKLAENEVKNYQKRLEELVEHRTEDLVKARDNALIAERSMSVFLSNMSHELRTPLHAIIGFADFGVKKVDQATSEKLRDYFNKIHQSGNHLLELVNELLDLSKLRSGKMSYQFKPELLKPIIDHVIKELSILSERKNITIQLITPNTQNKFEIDHLRFSQVARNLISNAIKFSPENSNIEIKLQEDEKGATLSVKDEGPGIPDNELDMIFEAFSQSSLTATKAGGTGLGLPICKEIIESGHGGWIRASNNKSSGAVFTIYIPNKTGGTLNKLSNAS